MERSIWVKITGMQNPSVKGVVKLRSRSGRNKQDTYLIEGYREIVRSQTGKVPLRELFVCPEYFLGNNERNLIEKIENTGTVIRECSPSVFSKISYRDGPDGLLAVALKKPVLLEEVSFKNKVPFILLAVAIEKPGNLGTILRSADAAGADAVFVVDRVTDIYNPNVIRASVGTLFTQPVSEVTSEEIIPWLREKGFRIIASSPDAQKKYTEVNFQEPVAILVGSEQYGLPEKWFSTADETVSIPMKGVADSLNVATSTTLLLYEVLRQRVRD